MKKAGLIGGMSWESTVTYYQIMNRIIGQQLGGNHSADLVIRSLNLELIDSHQRRGEWDAVAELLCRAARELESLGVDAGAVATFCREEFGKRVYDTFTLPAGVYDTLRITIGEGEGHNWWCVVFPSLCLPATSEGFAEAASCAGFPEELTAALEGEEGYEIRFYFLDLIGRIENLLRGE